jgi:hypothetical protein
MCVCSLCRSQPSFLPHYVQIASRKLLLFHGRRNLGPKGRRLQQQQDVGRSSSSSELILRLSDLVNSPVMAELQELLLLGPGAEQERDLYSNWFSLQVRCCAPCFAAKMAGADRLTSFSYMFLAMPCHMMYRTSLQVHYAAVYAKGHAHTSWQCAQHSLMPQPCWLNMSVLLLAAVLLLLLPLQSTQRVLATFNAWDLDGNGTLSKTEFSAISQVGTHSSAAHAAAHSCVLCNLFVVCEDC